jgi:hypothetical protein
MGTGIRPSSPVGLSVWQSGSCVAAAPAHLTARGLDSATVSCIVAAREYISPEAEMERIHGVQ